MGLRLVGWGLVAVLVDLRLNGFDVLPDVVGWGLVLAGLWALASLAVDFARARLAALLGLVAAGIELGLFFSEGRYPVAESLAGVVVTTCTLACGWFLLHGVARRARAVAPGAVERSLVLAHRLLAVFGLLLAGEMVGLVIAMTGRELNLTLSGPGALVVVFVGIVLLVVAVQLVLFCFAHADEPWLAA
ncbi:hypothetical protein [Luteococcus peritonei]|uniref:Uncharacterized protein n=1 Tax=Luteococcus peritonei TaxID=88874 RepID=A0ABW4RV97_9ACTN